MVFTAASVVNQQIADNSLAAGHRSVRYDDDLNYSADNYARYEPSGSQYMHTADTGALDFRSHPYPSNAELGIKTVTRTTMGQPILADNSTFPKTAWYRKLRALFTVKGTGRHISR